MPKPIGELLVREKLISLGQLQKAMDEQRKLGGRVTEHLVKDGAIKEEALTGFISRQYGVPPIDLEQFQIDPEVIKLLPLELCQKHTIIPVNRAGQSLVVAVADPGNIYALDDVKFRTGYTPETMVASEAAIKKAIEKHYMGGGGGSSAPGSGELSGTVSDVMDVLEVVTGGDEDVNARELEKSGSDAPVVKLVNLFLVDALNKNASDIHIEPYEKFMRVRYRIDGVLYEVLKPPLAIKEAVASRVKIMSGLNISERRLPQDGRIRMKIGSETEPIDFRVSTLPTIFGERLVLRILRKAGLQEDMTVLGLETDQLGDYKWAIAQPYGMALVTGPSGSGKTTTLYSALMELNQPNINVSTVEDPVEYNITSLNQVQVRPDVGLTFAAALRSFLRQDPDVIMVGEIRDLETAEIAIKSALTGHLVLSTLHTNDAPSTVTRLLNMGVEPFLVASAVLLIVAQRLVRKVCTQCREPQQVEPGALVNLGISEEKAAGLTVYKGKGCKTCNNIGYRGRVGIYEVLRFNRQIREAILRGESTSEVRRIAVEHGMLTLRQSALRKLEAGVTSLEEVVRTTAITR
ncbi:MAG: type IV-A pilus assembly ATPase PilB [Deltaproteobacteria bacterium]|nr:type IV-A pilus assembly ATPase PilB [Deltaproteobacteria bacterium]